MKAKNIVSEVFFYAVGLVILVGFFLLSTFLMTHLIPEGNRDMIKDVLATLRDALMIIIGYFYGTSKSSADKNAIFDKQLNQTPTITNVKTS
ncbi:MAG: hypothetical protein WCO44_12430 [Bacteroidota bacterium]